MATPHTPLTRGTATGLLLLMALAITGAHLALLPADPVSLVFHDEVHYAQQARDVAGGGFPRYNHAFAAKFPPLYGVVQAAAWGIGGANGFAWWSRVMNVLILTSALVPAYRLARLGLGRGRAVAAAGLAVLLPFHAYTRFLLSENLLVPVTLWVALAVVRLCRRPSIGRALAAGAWLGLALHTKMMMVTAAPAAVLALGWARRSARDALRHGAWMGLALGVVVLPYLLRAHLFPSESSVKVLFTYYGELTGGGLQPLATFLHCLRAEPTFFVVALTPAVLLPALAGLFAARRHAAPADRGFAGFLLLTSLFTALLISIWIAQASYYASHYHERYFVGLWPLFTLAFVREAARPAGRTPAYLAAGALTLGLLVLAPDALFESQNLGRGFQLWDAPSTPGVMALAAATGGPIAARAALALAVLLVGLLFLRPARRWAAIALLIVVGVQRAHATAVAVGRAHRLERSARARMAPLWTWLEGILKPADRLVHHTFLGDIAYMNAVHFNRDLLVVDRDMMPNWVSGLRFDAATGRYRPRDLPPGGEIYLLTGVAGPASPEVVSFRGRYRLLRITRGLGPLGQWVNPDVARSAATGVHADRWCEPLVRLQVPVAYPKVYRAALILHHPLDSPIRGPLHFQIRGPAGALKWLTLGRGQRTTIRWTGTVWFPEFFVEIRASRYAVREGRRIAFRIEGLSITPAP